MCSPLCIKQNIFIALNTSSTVSNPLTSAWCRHFYPPSQRKSRGPERPGQLLKLSQLPEGSQLDGARCAQTLHPAAWCSALLACED